MCGVASTNSRLLQLLRALLLPLSRCVRPSPSSMSLCPTLFLSPWLYRMAVPFAAPTPVPTPIMLRVAELKRAVEMMDLDSNGMIG